MVEASAGTGKTYTLSFLFIRLYLEYKVPFNKIVVITFTELATEELKSRVFKLLKDTRQNLTSLIAAKPQDDSLISNWLQSTFKTEEYSHLLNQVDLAILMVDKIKISTIHGFCMDLLKEFYIYTGFDPNTVLLDDKQWKDRTYRWAQSYWLKQFNCLETTESLICKKKSFTLLFSNPESLIKDIPLNTVGRAVSILIEELEWEEELILIQKGGTSKAVKESVQRAKQYFKNDFLQYLTVKTKELQNQGFSNHNLTISETVRSTNNPDFKKLVGQRINAIMVDEFQDTDFLQWQIISKLFIDVPEKHKPYIYLIGDPKQSIYRFRSADVDCYFESKRKAHNVYSLNTNWRSDEIYLKSLNGLYSAPHFDNGVFRNKELQYYKAEVPESKKAQRTLLFPENQYQDKAFILRKPDNISVEIKVDQAQKKVDEWLLKDCQILYDSIQNGEILKVDDNQSKKIIQPSDVMILLPTNALINHVSELLSSVDIPTSKVVRDYSWKQNSATIVIALLNLLSNEEENGVSQKNIKTLVTLLGHQLDRVEVLENSFFLAFNHWGELIYSNGPYALWERLTQNNLLGDYGFSNKVSQQQFINKLDSLFIELQNWWGEGMNSLSFLLDKIKKVIEEEQSYSIKTNAFKLMTFFTAKGLEAEIVICPYLWKADYYQSSISEYLKYSQTKHNYIILDKGNKSLWLEERNRILYVALTRASGMMLIYWLPMLNSLTRNDSSLQRFLFGEELFSLGRPSQSSVRANLYTKKFDSIKEIEGVLLLDEKEFLLSHTYKSKQIKKELQEESQDKATKKEVIKSFKKFKEGSGLWSFSRLLYLTKQVEHKEKTKLSDDKFYSVSSPRIELTPLQIGNLVHLVLQTVIEKSCQSKQADYQNIIVEVIDNHLNKTTLLEDKKLTMTTFIKNLCLAVLAKKIPLGQQMISIYDCLISETKKFKLYPEVRFDLNINDWHIEKLNQLAEKYPENQLSEFNKTHIQNSLFSGFIDLLLHVDNQVWIIDYKTNFLGINPEDYSQNQLGLSMKTHHYGWQACFYAYAVSRWLKLRSKMSHQLYTGYFFARGLECSKGENGLWLLEQNPELLSKMAKILDE